MKADRLVATLLFLQARGRVTVRQVAEELEISERTARRDLEALSAAGVPVYSQRGRGGGWSLVGGARTDLTGFTQREIGALFLAAGPLSASPELRAALRKLVQAVPAPMRTHAEAASKALVVDGLDWSRAAVRAAGGPHHHALEQAVLDRVRITVGYADEGAPRQEWTVDPLGLVCKAGRWYTVAADGEGLRSFLHTRVASVTVTGEPARRPEGFDLAEAWQELAAEAERRLRATTVRAAAGPAAVPGLRELLGDRLRTGELRPDGRCEIEADGPSVEILVAQLAGAGADVEVLEPPEARARLARLGQELAAAHGGAPGGGSPAPRNESHFPLGTYYVEDASVDDVTERSTVRPSRRRPRQRLSTPYVPYRGAVS
ncbi:helix-turn-helix transcriptional regulator [Streptomyces sp. NPDC006978]|uniref:helix-turn-helix transcriptional regulator n=1 Tax=Streptomyces sp. NPDC006978 TaxID=3364769 RepID=UPI0036B7B256